MLEEQLAEQNEQLKTALEAEGVLLDENLQLRLELNGARDQLASRSEECEELRKQLDGAKAQMNALTQERTELTVELGKAREALARRTPARSGSRSTSPAQERAREVISSLQEEEEDEEEEADLFGLDAPSDAPAGKHRSDMGSKIPPIYVPAVALPHPDVASASSASRAAAMDQKNKELQAQINALAEDHAALIIENKSSKSRLEQGNRLQPGGRSGPDSLLRQAVHREGVSAREATVSKGLPAPTPRTLARDMRRAESLIEDQFDSEKQPTAPGEVQGGAVKGSVPEESRSRGNGVRKGLLVDKSRTTAATTQVKVTPRTLSRDMREAEGRLELCEMDCPEATALSSSEAGASHTSSALSYINNSLGVAGSVETVNERRGTEEKTEERRARVLKEEEQARRSIEDDVMNSLTPDSTVTVAGYGVMLSGA